MSKARNGSSADNPRLADVERQLARQFILLQSRRIRQLRSGIFTPRCVYAALSSENTVDARFSYTGWTCATIHRTHI